MAELVVFVGIPGSGKSTFFRRTFAATHQIVSKDLMGRSRKQGKQERQMQMIDEHLAAGVNVVVDNLNVTLADREALIAAAKSRGAKTICFFFEPDPAGCLIRNAQRIGKARVPDFVIAMTLRRLRRPTPSEGFDEIYTVRLDNQGGFEIRPYDG